jgi:GntR family transcriptional regulator, arabinose operon transcriptional repressor
MESSVKFVRHSSEDTPRGHAKEAVVQMLLSRGYKAGDQLPSYRNLAEHFGIALCTLVRAMHEMIEEGTLQAMRGKGVFVRKLPYGGGKLTTVGLVYPASQMNLLRSSYLVQILTGTMDLCGQNEIDLQIVAFRKIGQMVHSPVSPRDLAMRVDGLILLGVVNDRYLAECARETIPLVLVDSQTQVAPIPCIAVDNERATNLVMDYLYGLGHQRIAYVDARCLDDLAVGHEPFLVDSADTHERREAYQAAAKRLGLDYVRIYPAAKWTKPKEATPYMGVQATGVAVLAALLKDNQPPTALLCYDDAVASHLYQALLGSRLRVPKDLSIAAAAAAPGSNLVESRLITGAVMDFEEMGRRAITALQRQTRRQPNVLPHVERIGGKLCVGTTTARPSHR